MGISDWSSDVGSSDRLELCNRYLAAGLERGEALTDPSAAGRYFAQRLRGHPSEIFAALFLDTRHRALAFEELFRGTVDGAEVHPREVVRRIGRASCRERVCTYG